MEVVILSRTLHIPIHWKESCVCWGRWGAVRKEKEVVPAMIKHSGKPASDTDFASSTESDTTEAT